MYIDNTVFGYLCGLITTINRRYIVDLEGVVATPLRKSRLKLLLVQTLGDKMDCYRGYVFKPYTDKNIAGTPGYWFVIMRPDGTWLSNSIFYAPGVLFLSAAWTRAGAVREVKRAIRRDRKTY